MNDDMLRTAYSELVDRRAGQRLDCASVESLLAVAERTGGEAERLETLRHVGACRHCKSELDLLLTPADAAQRLARPTWRARRLLAVAASAALLAGGVALWQALRAPAVDTLREGATTSVQLLAPPANIPAAPPVTLVWAAVPTALRYELEILLPDGSVAFAAVSRDTALVVPDAAALTPDTAYSWWVRAVLPDGTILRSAMAGLRIATPS